MTAISATMVKDLREKTGAGMMDCKAALNETSGDMEAAVDWLRTKGLAKAAKKAGRVAAEGLIGLAADDTQAALVEVNSETDFVARNDKFQEMVRTIAADALKAKGDLDKLAKAPYGGGKITVADHLKEMIGSIGENMTLRRSAYLGVKNGAVASYMHNTISPASARSASSSRSNRPATPPSSRASASRWRCTSPPPIRKASMLPVSIRPSSSASARC